MLVNLSISSPPPSPLFFFKSFTSRQSIGYSRDSNCVSQHANARRSIVMLEITGHRCYIISRKYVYSCLCVTRNSYWIPFHCLPRYIRSLFPPLSINRLIHGRWNLPIRVDRHWSIEFPPSPSPHFSSRL